MRRLTETIAFVAIFIFCDNGAQAQTYRITDLGTLGGTESYAYAINGKGQVVGRAQDASGLMRAVLFGAAPSANVDLGTLPNSSGESWAAAINNAGQIVGSDYDANGFQRAVSFDNTGSGKNIALGDLGGFSSSAQALNDSGQVVGWAATAPDANGTKKWHASLFDINGKLGIIDLDETACTLSVARAINNADLIAGDYNDEAMIFDPTPAARNVSLGQKLDGESIVQAINNYGVMVGCVSLGSSTVNTAALFRTDGTFLQLGTLGGESYATSINNNGQIVGYSRTPDGILHACSFAADGSGAVDLNTLIDPACGWELNTAFINDAGQICGWGTNPQGQVHAYFMTAASSRAPIFDSIPAVSAREGSLCVFAVTATDPGYAVTITASNLPSGATFSNNLFSWTPGYTQAGTYAINFSATSANGTSTKQVQFTVANTNRPPVINAIGAKTMVKGRTLTFNVIGSDPDGDTLTYKATTLPPGATFTGNTFTFTPASTGTFLAQFSVSDGQLTASTSVVITVNANHTPVLSAIGNKTVNENSSLSFNLIASDADGDALTYSANTLPAGAKLTGNTFSWTPSYTQSGTYKITFYASDGIASASQTITITVNNVDRPPVVNPIASKTVTRGTTLTFTVTGSDPDGTAVTLTAKNLPKGATFSNGIFTWKPALNQAGTYVVTFTATSAGLSGSATATITVK
jgi:probable HAF family extracellular repeat protein